LADDADRQAHARVGSVLDDKWTLERLLGIGGMAAVYGARHRNGARAAVKVLHAEFSSHKDVRERFLREGYAANRVEHAGAVKVLDDDVVAAGPAAGTAYIVMELLEGESLQERLERGPPVGELEFLAIARSVLEVLVAAHSRGVVHRDLKPENLFLVRGEADAKVGTRVKVLDFGLARLLQGQAITSYGLALGTPSFMSPEQAAGRIDEIDGRTDLFALAATGFRLCTGRRIHEALNPVDLVLKMANLAAPRVRAVRPDVSEPCARVIDRALEFRREDRYATATAMLEDVQRAVAELEVSGPTQLAVPMGTPESPTGLSGRRDVSAGDDTTVELSDGDLLRQAAGPVPEESVRVPKRRSIVPWLTLVALGAAGAKLWLNHRDRSGDASSASTSESALPTGGAAASALAPVVVRERDASSGAPNAAPSASLSRPTAAPATSAPHTAPGKVGPGNVHKLPRKHHASKPRTNQ
jgi:serine/threonine protein kinase